MILLSVRISPFKWIFPFSLFLFSFVCEARTYDSYVSYSSKGAFCSAIGGACASDTDMISGCFQNPASIKAGEPDFDFDGDYVKSDNPEPGVKPSHNRSENSFLGAVAWGGEKWGFGIGLSGKNTSVHTTTTILDGQGNSISTPYSSKGQSFTFYLSAAFRYSENLSLGLSMVDLYHSESVSTELYGNAKASPSKNYIGLPGFTLGAIYLYDSHWRFGLWLRTPSEYTTQLEIGSFTESIRLYNPLIVEPGLSYMPWADDRTLLFDLKFIGTTKNAYLLTYDDFASENVYDPSLQRKGQEVSLEPRIGWRSKMGRKSDFSYMAGSYWEDIRLSNVKGRLHFTAGLTYQPLHWLEAMVGFDVSNNFFQTLVTFR